MVAPGDPELAADLARRAAQRQPRRRGDLRRAGGRGDGGAGVRRVRSRTAARHAAVSLIPRDSIIARLIDDVREWHAADRDWRATRERIAGNYGYDKYGGNCHMVPNHALIILGAALRRRRLPEVADDRQHRRLGHRLQLRQRRLPARHQERAGRRSTTGPDWRGPVADRLYLPTADGGRAITDAVTETFNVVNIGRALAGEAPLAPKDGARFHFELPGSVQGFQPRATASRRAAR